MYRVASLSSTFSIARPTPCMSFTGVPSATPHVTETSPPLQATMHGVYEKTQNKMPRLRTQGYNVTQMWECEWTHLKQTRPDIQAYVNSLQFVESLKPRDALCGGRTNAAKLYHHVTPGQKIHSIDYTSLYPWVNKTCIYPKGHPQFISQPGHKHR